MEGAYINIKLIIGNRESRTGNWFLVPYLEENVSDISNNTNISKVQIGNKEPVPVSFLIIILYILVSGYVYFISM